MRYFLLFCVICTVMVVAIAGKRGSLSRRPPIEWFPDMVRQPKLRPQTPDAFFQDDGRGSRLPVPGTIAREDTHYADLPVNTGHVIGKTNFIDTIPVEVNAKLLARGQQRFQINCLPCHGAQADGNGITKKIGAMALVANLQDKRIVEMQDGEIFNTISNGKGMMGPYGPNVVVEDRWAIIAYLRALQLSKLGSVDDVPEAMRGNLKK